jgi:hypothetical protein
VAAVVIELTPCVPVVGAAVVGLVAGAGHRLVLSACRRRCRRPCRWCRPSPGDTDVPELRPDTTWWRPWWWSWRRACRLLTALP